MKETLSIRSMGPPFRLIIHACRKTWVEHRMPLFLSRPIWRIYRYPNEGGGVEFQGKSIYPSPDELLIVPPNTPVRHLLTQPCWHYWLHVSPGYPFNAVKGKVFCQKLTSAGSVLFRTAYESEGDSPNTGAKVVALVAYILSRLPEEALSVRGQDPRISSVLDTINETSGGNLSNTELAEVAGMSCNAFIRLFRQVVGQSPRTYILERRLDDACTMLTYTDHTLDTIAERCGFRERGYMTRVFKLKRDITPARYRKENRVL